MQVKSKVVLASILGTGLAASGFTAYAATTPNPNGPMTNLVQAIAQRFNLNSTDVEQVVEDTMASNRALRMAEQETAYQDRLNKALSLGKLTQEQVNKLLERHQTVKAERESLAGKTGDELRNALKTIQTENQTWAKDNNIPIEFLGPGVRAFGPRGPDGRKIK